jgi:hypothetical protein
LPALLDGVLVCAQQPLTLPSEVQPSAWLTEQPAWRAKKYYIKQQLATPEPDAEDPPSGKWKVICNQVIRSVLRAATSDGPFACTLPA